MPTYEFTVTGTIVCADEDDGIDRLKIAVNDVHLTCIRSLQVGNAKEVNVW